MKCVGIRFQSVAEDSRYAASLFLLGLATVCFAGCGGNNTAVPVRGKVTLDGKLVTEGRVRFHPEAGTVGPVAIAPIDKHGRYEVSNKGGVPIGSQRVEIVAYALEGIGPALDGNDPSIDMANPSAALQQRSKKLPIPVYEVQGLPQFLPPEYNRHSKLTVQVTGEESPQTVDFDLKSKNS